MVILLIKIIPKSSRTYVVPCQIEFMLKSTQALLYLTGILIYARLKKCPTILFAVNLWLKPVSAAEASHNPGSKCTLFRNKVRTTQNMDNADILL